MKTGKGLLAAFSLLFSVSALAMLFSVATNKILAVVAGPEGMARMTLYRSLGGWTVSILSLGFGTLLTQRLSVARTGRERDAALSAAGIILAGQAVGCACLAVFFGGAIARWLFGGAGAAGDVAGVRVALVMTFANLFLQAVLVAARGCGEIRALGAIQLATSFLSLLLIYPLLRRLGDLGLAVNVGSGAILGSLAGFVLLRRPLALRAGTFLPDEGWRVLRGMGSGSVVLSLPSVAFGASLIFLQTLAGRTYGVEALGNLGAALLIVDMAVLLLMSSARSYVLPALGASQDEGSKRELTASMFRMLLVTSTAVGIVAALLGRPLVTLLFSGRFDAASGLLSVLFVSVLGQASGWTFNTYLLHRDCIRTIAAVECGLALAVAIGAWACVRLGLGIGAMAWSYSLAQVVYGAVYPVVASKVTGERLLSSCDGCVALLCLAAMGAAIWVRWWVVQP